MSARDVCESFLVTGVVLEDNRRLVVFDVMY